MLWLLPFALAQDDTDLQQQVVPQMEKLDEFEALLQKLEAAKQVAIERHAADLTKLDAVEGAAWCCGLVEQPPQEIYALPGAPESFCLAPGEEEPTWEGPQIPIEDTEGPQEEKEEGPQDTTAPEPIP